MFKNKRNIFGLIAVIFYMQTSFLCIGQTVIKMELPKQADKAFAVKTLFNEQLPSGNLVVLGALGYEIEGGTSPYLLSWYENSQLIATGNVLAFKPIQNADYSLVVKDKNNCSQTLSINVDALKKVIENTNHLSDIISVSPTLVKDHMMITFNSDKTFNVGVKIYDINGNICLNTAISGNTHLPVALQSGLHIVIIQHNDDNLITKIMVE